MATDADIYSLFMGGQDAPAQAQAMAEALRRRRESASLARNAGNVALLTGDRVLSAFGNAQMRQAGEGMQEVGQGEGMLAQAGGQQAGRQLQEMLAQRQQAAQAEQGRLQRGMQWDIAGLTDARERDKMAAENERARLKAEKANAKAPQKAATDYRKEFNLLQPVKDFYGIEAAYEGVKDSIEDMSGTGSTSIIFNYMKMLDPGVAVMEGDVARIRSSGGPAAQYADMYGKLLKGNDLPPEVRKDIIKRATGLFNVRKKQFNSLATRFRGLAEKAGANPDDVAMLLDMDEPAPGAATPAATPTGSFDLGPSKQQGTALPPRKGNRVLMLKDGKPIGYIDPNDPDDPGEMVP